MKFSNFVWLFLGSLLVVFVAQERAMALDSDDPCYNQHSRNQNNLHGEDCQGVTRHTRALEEFEGHHLVSINLGDDELVMALCPNGQFQGDTECEIIFYGNYPYICKARKNQQDTFKYIKKAVKFYITSIIPLGLVGDALRIYGWGKRIEDWTEVREGLYWEWAAECLGKKKTKFDDVLVRNLYMDYEIEDFRPRIIHSVHEYAMLKVLLSDLEFTKSLFWKTEDHQYIYHLAPSERKLSDNSILVFEKVITDK